MDALLSRTFADAASGGTLAVTVETRKIIIAEGIQFTDDDMTASGEIYGVMPGALTAPRSARKKWPKAMAKRDPLSGVVTTSGGFEFTSLVQGVKFEVSIVKTKDAFRKALLTPGAHVIYDGHARYGRGPCFGLLPKPGEVSRTEDWENGSNPATTGLFRMGYPFIAVPITEIFEHGYTADLIPSTVKVTPELSEHDLRLNISSLKAKTADSMDPALRAQITDKDPAKTWWAYRGPSEGKMTWFVVLNAGWTGTVSAPFDLGATTPTCRVFCHFGCESYQHNQPILRSPTFKGWQKSGDDKFAFFTSSLSVTGTTTYWLYHLLTYNKKNAFLDWEPSLHYAVSKTNDDLATSGESYRVI